MKSASKRWFALTILPTAEDPDSEQVDRICVDLVELGASGTAVTHPPEIVAYIEGDETDCKNIENHLPVLDCYIKSRHEIVDTNWTGACPDVWEPLCVGNLTIKPVESSDSVTEVPQINEILLIPGLGFGTGHHATTRMMVAAIQKELQNSNSSQLSILDIGTGSGILAIVATKFSSNRIEAIDIDEDALNNARDNCVINKVEHQVALSTTALEDISAVYDLILANVYGEVLITMAPHFTAISKSGTRALLSGITEIVWPSVQEAFLNRGVWSLKETSQEGEWMCATLVRC